VSAEALTEFSADGMVADLTSSQRAESKIFCASVCLNLRGNPHENFEACNSFVIDGTSGRCKLGYMSPSWFLTFNQTGSEIIFTDVFL